MDKNKDISAAVKQPTGDLPPLPERPKSMMGRTLGYSDDDIRDYARAAIAAHLAGQSQATKVQAVPEGYVLMPKRLTAENGAKAALSGEFMESVRVTCHECEGTGEGEDDEDCATCKGDGTVDAAVPVGWDTIKDIYKAAVALLAAPTAQEVTQQAAKAETAEQANEAKLYRKTALVSAEQFLPAEGKIPAGVISDGHGDPRKNPSHSFVLDTKEGRHILRDGDYICTGPAGEKWNVERSIFESTYELANLAPTTSTVSAPDEIRNAALSEAVTLLDMQSGWTESELKTVGTCITLISILKNNPGIIPPDALRTVSTAAAQNAEAIRNQWISVDERMPKDGQTVLISCPDPTPEVWEAQWLAGSQTFESKANGWVRGDEASHWMPLPEAPALQTGSANTLNGGEA